MQATHAAAGRRHGSHRARHLRPGEAHGRLNAPVSAIRRAGDARADRAWAGRAGDRSRLLHLHAAAADPARRSRAISRRRRKPRSAVRPICRSVKLAFEAPRFWETDDNIFGGLAWTDRANENVIYPSHGYGARKGVHRRRLCAPAGPTRIILRRSRLSATRSAFGSAAIRSRRCIPDDRICSARAVTVGVGAGALFGRRGRPLARLDRGRALRAARGPDMPSCSSPKDRSSSPASI